MKKLLLIHNLYRDFGGEDAAFHSEVELLKANYEVEIIMFDNKDKLNIYDVINFIFLTNLKSNSILKTTLENFNPDIVYFHNLWFKGSLGLLTILKKLKVPVVVKIHNFRYLCANTFSSKKHIGNNEFCPACGLKTSKIFNRYFEESFIKSLFAIRFSKRFYNLLSNSNFKMLLLTNHHKNILIEKKFIEKKLFVLPNYIVKGNTKVSNSKKQFLYAGRISKEKGLEELIKSFLAVSLKNFSLKIIGTGPDFERLKQKYPNKRVVFTGFMKNQDVQKEILKSSVVVSATKLYEGQPTLLCEASLNSVPVIFPNSGGIKEFLPKDYEFLFEQNNYEELKRAMLTIIDSDLKKIGNENEIFINNLMDKKNLLEVFSKATDK